MFRCVGLERQLSSWNFSIESYPSITTTRRRSKKQRLAEEAVRAVGGAQEVCGLRDAAQEGAAHAGAVQETSQVGERSNFLKKISYKGLFTLFGFLDLLFPCLQIPSPPLLLCYCVYFRAPQPPL